MLDFNFLDTIQLQKKQEDNTFNLFSVLEHRMNENTYSQLLTSLFTKLPFDGDYKALELFLQECEIDTNNFKMSAQDITVETEKALGNGRHDIWIQACDSEEGKTRWAISIENKLKWANDQHKQVKRYFEDLENLENRSEDYHYALIYLHPAGKHPSESSINEEDLEKYRDEKKFFTMDRKKLVNWLDKLMTHYWKDLFANQRFYFFIEDIKRLFQEDTVDAENIENILQKMKTRDKWEAYFGIAQYQDKILMDKLTNIREQLSETEGFYYEKYSDKKDKSVWKGNKYFWVIDYPLPNLQRLLRNKDFTGQYHEDIILVLEYSITSKWFAFGIRSKHINTLLKEKTDFSEELKKVYPHFLDDIKPTWAGSRKWLGNIKDIMIDILLDQFDDKVQQITELKNRIETIAKKLLNQVEHNG